MSITRRPLGNGCVSRPPGTHLVPGRTMTPVPRKAAAHDRCIGSFTSNCEARHRELERRHHLTADLLAGSWSHAFRVVFTFQFSDLIVFFLQSEQLEALFRYACCRQRCPRTPVSGPLKRFARFATK
eukprot:RCo031262